MTFFGKTNQIGKNVLSLIDDLLETLIEINSDELGEYFYNFYDFLKENNFNEENKMEFPLDTVAYYSSFNKYNSIHFSNFNCTHYNFIVILENDDNSTRKNFTCLQYYDEIDDLNLLKPNNALIYNTSVIESYSDNIEGNNYVRRPDLNFIYANVENIINEECLYFFKPMFKFPMKSSIKPNPSSIQSYSWFYTILDLIDSGI